MRLHSFIKQAGNRSNSILRLSLEKSCYHSYPLREASGTGSVPPKDRLIRRSPFQETTPLINIFYLLVSNNWIADRGFNQAKWDKGQNDPHSFYLPRSMSTLDKVYGHGY